MTTAVATRNGNGNGHPPADIVESVVIRGDLARLSDSDRVSYYHAVCKSVGLNPLTKPFEYITLNGKLTLYALRGCTDQLRSIHKVSVIDMSDTERDGVFVVTAKVQNGEGRTDMAKGAVTIGGLKGDALANALMKAETKAKRRATLSICGLGFLDETEIETIPGVRRNPHVTTAEDIVGEVSAADSIPNGDGHIKPLPKKDTRPQFEAMQKEMYAIKTPEELAEWGRANKNKKQMFKEDWQQILSGLYAAHMETLRNKPPADDGLDIPPELDRRQPKNGDVPTDPEKFLKWIDGVLGAVTEPGMLDRTWDFRVEPHLGQFLPPDQDEAMGIYRKHEARLAP